MIILQPYGTKQRYVTYWAGVPLAILPLPKRGKNDCKMPYVSLHAAGIEPKLLTEASTLHNTVFAVMY